MHFEALLVSCDVRLCDLSRVRAGIELCMLYLQVLGTMYVCMYHRLYINIWNSLFLKFIGEVSYTCYYLEYH